MSGIDVWSDFETLRYNIKHNTVDKLKQILTGFNDECSTTFFKSGKKQELIDRIVTQLDTWRQTNNSERWNKARAVIYQVRTSGIYSPSALSTLSSVHTAPILSHVPYATSATKPFAYQHTTPGSGNIGRYDPFSSPRKLTAPVAPPIPSTSSSVSNQHKPALRFRSSPFFHIDQAVSNIVECPESTSITDRRQQIVAFTLNEDQIAKLKSTNSKYQLRLFCTSSMFYSPGLSDFRTNAGPCAIEFPPTCEVRVNNVALATNLKGLKKKPGTAPPADLGKAVRISPVQNRVEMVYVNSQQPVTAKKYYLVVMLVEVTTVEQLVDRLKKGKYRTSNDIRIKMFSNSSDDDDIVAGPQKMSLKCPLSFMRIKTPCRSTYCVHSQCFDATSWYSVMEQTTTWLCPVCEKILNPEDLIIDGYFDEILRLTPESVEDVMVESNGEWHTSDNSHASAIWRSTHQPPTAEKPPPRPLAPVIKVPESSGPSVGIFVMDSDDEDEGRVKQELSPSYGRRDSSASANRSFEGISVPQTQSQSQAADDVIDLTLDSDDDDNVSPPPPPPPPPRLQEKRKAPEGGMSPTEQIWKKGRLDVETVSGISMPSEHRVNGASSSSPNGYDTATLAHYSSHRSQSSSGQNLSHTPIGSPPTQYIAPFPPGLPQYSYNRPPPPRTTSGSNDPRLSSLPRNPYLPRINSRWPGT